MYRFHDSQTNLRVIEAIKAVPYVTHWKIPSEYPDRTSLWIKAAPETKYSIVNVIRRTIKRMPGWMEACQNWMLNSPTPGVFAA